jgi:hypothetical protein
MESTKPDMAAKLLLNYFSNIAAEKTPFNMSNFLIIHLYIEAYVQKK